MAILNEKFGFVIRDASTGLPTSGQLVELREGLNNYVLTEKATSGFYEVASIPTGKYSAYVNSVDSGSTFGVGTGQVAALGNTLNNVAVSTASEFGFQSPSVFKATLDLDLVTNKAIPLAVAADENKIISVNASGDYALTSPSSTGFAAVFEANSASELEAALGAAISRKTIIITKAFGTFNYANSKTISVYGQNVFYGNSIDFSCGSGIVVDFINDVSDPGVVTMQFFNNIVSFGSNGKFVGEIEPVVSIRNIAIVDAQIDDTGPGTSSLSYEKQFVLNQSGTKSVSQYFWDNTSGAAGGQVDSVGAGTNITITGTATDPIVNAAAAPITSIFGRVGVVISAFADYVAGQIGFTPYNYVTSIDVGGAIGEVVDKTNVNALAIATKGDAFLSNTQTFTGVNTFDEEIVAPNGIKTELATNYSVTALPSTYPIGYSFHITSSTTDIGYPNNSGTLCVGMAVTFKGSTSRCEQTYYDRYNGKIYRRYADADNVWSATTSTTWEAHLRANVDNNFSVDQSFLTNINVTDYVKVRGGDTGLGLSVATLETDLDDYQAGTFLLTPNTTTITNAPSFFTNSGGRHLVFTPQNAFGTGGQIAYETGNLGTGKIAMRSMSGGVWQPWRRVDKYDPLIGTIATSSSLTIDASITDQYNVTALASALSINAPTSPTNGQKLTIRIKDDGTTRTLTWNAIFRTIGTTLPLSTTANKTIYVGCIYNSNDTKWDVVAVSEEA